MDVESQARTTTPRREPWNKGKFIGQKPPLRPKHVWSIRTRLQMEGRTRDLAIFNLAIDSNLRGAMSSHFGSRMSHQAGTRLIVPQCGRRRLGGPSGLN